MSKFKTLKIPDTLNDMSVDHLPFFMTLASMAKTDEEGKPIPFNENILEELESYQVADLVTLFFNEQPGAFDQFTPAANKNMLLEIAKSCTRHIEKEIQPFYIVDGIKYVWQKDYSQQPVSFHRDVASVDFKETPLDLMAFCYIEEGMIYNQPHEKTKAVLNPRKERAEKLKSCITLADYLTINTFFLESYHVFRPFFIQKQRKESQKKRSQKNGTGKSQ